MDWQCCWTSQTIEPAECPYIQDDERELYTSLQRRFLEKCLDCPRFKSDLEKLAEEGHPLSRVFRYLTDEFLEQKEQLHFMAAFLNSRNREIRFLHEIGIVLQTSMDLDEVLSVAMTAITAGKGFGMNRAFLLLADHENKTLKGYLGVGPRSYQEAWQIWEDIGKTDFSLKELATNFHATKFSSERVKFHDILEQITIPLADQSHILIRSLMSGKPVLVQDAFHNNDVDTQLARTLAVDTFLILPLISHKHRIGVIIADNFITHKPITTQDMESMETLAFPVALAIERASLYERLQEDLVKLTEANQKLKEQQQIIVKMEKMALVGNITSSIAHSIRNPLMIIGGFARSLQKGIPDNDPKREFADSILHEARQLEDALTEILGYADSLYPTRDLWDINQLVINVCRELNESMEKAGISHTLTLGDRLPMVFIDYRQIAFCLRKILSITLESLPERGRIEISTRLEGDRVALEILESNHRITGTEQDFITPPPFTAREQIDSMAVSLCRMILEKNSQAFRVETAEGGEMKYTIWLDVKKEEMSHE